MSSPGWYQDPEGDGWRWWDGTAWGPRQVSEPAQPLALGPRTGFDFGSGWAAHLTKLVAVAAGVAAAITALTILYTLIVGKVPGAQLLMLPAVPLLIVGQLWCIAVLNGRIAERRRATGNRSRWPGGGLRLADLRGGLSVRAAVLFLMLFYTTVLAGAVPAVLGLTSGVSDGTLTNDPANCEHSSNNHGIYRCLTESEFTRKSILEQRLAAGVMCGFFVAHCGLATGEVLRQRELASATVG